MTKTFPSLELLATWDHFDLDYAYKQSDAGWKCMEQVDSKDHEDYELFAVGFRMASVMSVEPTAGRVTAEETLEIWQSANPSTRNIYIEAAKERPDYQLNPEYFEYTPVEEHAFEQLTGKDRSRMKLFFVGVRIWHPKTIGKSAMYQVMTVA